MRRDEGTRKLFRSIDPKFRQILIGAGLAFDPLPTRRYSTFIESEQEALWDDWSIIAQDLAVTFEQGRRSRSTKTHG